MWAYKWGRLQVRANTVKLDKIKEEERVRIGLLKEPVGQGHNVAWLSLMALHICQDKPESRAHLANISASFPSPCASISKLPSRSRKKFQVV